jgi:hypothetical protein
MLIVAFCDTKVGKKIRIGKKCDPINHGLTLVNRAERSSGGRYFSTFIRTISIRVSLTLTISNS